MLAVGGLGRPVALVPTRGLGIGVGGVVPPTSPYAPGGGPEKSETYRAPWTRRRSAIHAGEMYAPKVYRELEEGRKAKRTPEVEKRGEAIILEIEGTEFEIRPSKGPTVGRELRSRAKAVVLQAVMDELNVDEGAAREALRSRIIRERAAINAWRQALIDDDELFLLLMVI